MALCGEVRRNGDLYENRREEEKNRTLVRSDKGPNQKIFGDRVPAQGVVATHLFPFPMVCPQCE